MSNNYKETTDHNKKIKDLKKHIYHPRISISRNLKKDLNISVNKNLSKPNHRIKSTRVIIPAKEKSTRAQSVGKRKLTFTYNRSIPILLQKPKYTSKTNSLSKLLKISNDITTINFKEDLGTIELNKNKSSNVKSHISENKGKQENVNM